MQPTAFLHKKAVLTFAQEDHTTKWNFDKVVIITLANGEPLIGRSCTSDAHPFHVHRPGFASLFDSHTFVPLQLPKEIIDAITIWQSSKNTLLGEKERKLKRVEELLSDFFHTSTES